MIVRAFSFVLLIVELVLLALLALRQASGETLPVDDVLRDSVDLIELNHFYDEYGRLVFDQEIFWDFESYRRSDIPSYLGYRYQVRAWRLVKHESQIPRRDFDRGGSTESAGAKYGPKNIARLGCNLIPNSPSAMYSPKRNVVH